MTTCRGAQPSAPIELSFLTSARDAPFPVMPSPTLQKVVALSANAPIANAPLNSSRSGLAVNPQSIAHIRVADVRGGVDLPTVNFG